MPHNIGSKNQELLWLMWDTVVNEEESARKEETARIHQDIEKLEAGQSPLRKKKKYTSLDSRIARIVDRSGAETDQEEKKELVGSLAERNCLLKDALEGMVNGRRMERVKWTDRIRNGAVLERVDEERMMLKLTREKERNWLDQSLRGNCLLKGALVVMANGRKIRGGRRYQMIDDIKIYGSYAETKKKEEKRKN
ncbi:hypothetical protein ANN_21069 [Periplaneta americana]|uniref:Uncharacterized protein n=1 Tax=Periplaneta americana TaxID=6978 RepID=A0ABQ8SFH2_PERAM|nr:hypothetical protein ANN_21069 [Periplaneta americana]